MLMRLMVHSVLIAKNDFRRRRKIKHMINDLKLGFKNEKEMKYKAKTNQTNQH